VSRAADDGPRRVIVTGGPGAGKTSLLDGLGGRGYRYMPDSARAIIKDRVRRGWSARPDAPQFAAAILRMDVAQYRQAPIDVPLVFFDRAIPDALCMLNDVGLLSMAEAEQRVTHFPYCRQVFVAPPWQDIYETDRERDQTFAHAIAVHRRAAGWYAALGFELIELPRVPVDERCDFVLERLRITP
jgi:predicted ATPase